MKQIGLISDTHGFLDETIFQHFSPCDEIWHAGDFGNLELARTLQAFKPLRGVYGNIDDAKTRQVFGEKLFFHCEDILVYMQHIGGYPGRYAKGVKENIMQHQAHLFISGHSHILKIMYDEKLGCLHMNPGAAGKQGWHTKRTLIRFQVDKKDIKNCEVIELDDS